MGEGNQKLKKEGDGVGARPPRSTNRSGGRAGDWGRPTTSTRVGPVPCLRRRNPECMKTTWWARRAEATGEATSPHPVIMGNGRPESRASPPFVYRTAPPRLPPLKEGTGVSPLFRRKKIVHDVTRACAVRPPRTPPTSRTPRTPRPHDAAISARRLGKTRRVRS